MTHRAIFSVILTLLIFSSAIVCAKAMWAGDRDVSDRKLIIVLLCCVILEQMDARDRVAKGAADGE